MGKRMWVAVLLGVLMAVVAAGGAFASGAARAKDGILLVAFGTSEPDARGAIDRVVEFTKKTFPDREVRLAYTSNIIRRKILKEQNIAMDTPAMALSKMQDEGFQAVTVQSLHIIAGEEYDQLAEVVRGFGAIRGKYGIARLSIGAPLLDTFEDYERVVELLKNRYGKYANNKGETVVLMGHGTHHRGNASYSQLQLMLDDANLPFVVGSVEGFPELDQVKRRLEHMKATKVTLVPFMVVAGDHAKNDMADAEDPESWLSVLKKEGYAVEAVLQGLGDGDDGLAEIFADHIREASAEE